MLTEKTSELLSCALGLKLDAGLVRQIVLKSIRRGTLIGRALLAILIICRFTIPVIRRIRQATNRSANLFVTYIT
jgi:hypothetical protein